MIENTGGEQTVAVSAYANFAKTFRTQLKKGEEKYGTVLKTFNGRDPGEDAFQELVDLSQYLEQLIMERQAFADILFYCWNKSQVAIPPVIAYTLNDMFEEGEEELERVAKKWGLK